MSQTDNARGTEDAKVAMFAQVHDEMTWKARWLGYALDNYIATLQSAWAGQLPAEKALGMDDEIALYAGELPPADYVPPAKQMSQIME